MSKKLVPSPNYSPVFNRLIELSQKQGESISNLLDDFSSSRSAITAWKNGNINLDVIPKIAERYGVSVDYLLTGENITRCIEKVDILQNITDIAKNKGLTLTEIERECGFSKSSMRKWSENIPSVGKIMTVAEYLGVSVDMILRTEENAKRCLKKLELPLPTKDEEELLNNYRKVSQESKLLISERARTLAELEAADTDKKEKLL